MKYKPLTYRINTWLAVLVLTLSACVMENDTPNTGGGGTEPEDVTVLLSLNVPAASAASRGLTGAQQEAIKFIDVLVFDKADKLTDWKYGVIERDDQNNVSFSARLKASEDDNDKYRLMVLANVRNLTYRLFDGDNLGGHKNKSYNEVRALLWDVAPAMQSSFIENGIPMWGEMENNVLVNQLNKNYNMTLIRSLARIDVGTSATPGTISGEFTNYQALENFSLEKVYVYNRSTKYSVAPEKTKYNFTDKKVTAISLVDNTKDATPTEYAGTDYLKRDNDSKGISMTAGIYCAEADVKMKTSGALYGDENHPNRMALVVAGYYTEPGAQTPNTSKLSYYRIDFTDGGKTTNLNDVLRNNAYQVIIKSVTGPGSETKEDAVERFNVDIDADIKAWDTNTTNTVVNGQYFLTVSDTDLQMGKWAIDDTRLTVTTNVATGWTAKVVQGGDWLTLRNLTTGATLTETSGSSDDEFRFAVTAIPGATTERTAKIRVTVATPGTDKTMSNDIYVTQTQNDQEFMLRLSHSEFMFPGRKIVDAETFDSPESQTLRIAYGPNNQDYAMSLTPYMGGGLNIQGETFPQTSSATSMVIGVDAIEEDDPRVLENPFYERSSRLEVTVNNTDQTETITKTVMVRQVYYSMVVTGQRDYYFDGLGYEWTLRSNTPWKITISDESILEGVSGKTGVGVTTTTGEKFKFKVKKGTRPNTTITITVESDTEEPLFVPQIYTVVVQDDLPNSYIVKPGEYQDVEVRKAYRVWALDCDLYNNDGRTLNALPGNREAKLLWQDTPGLITSVSPVLGTEGEGLFRVQTASGKTGNALVAFTIGGEIYWSWHIWVVDPASIGEQVSKGYTLMDRYLGATSATRGDNGTIGLHFQGGRKDPFPGPTVLGGTTAKTLYDVSNNILSGTQAVVIKPALSEVAIASSIRNPLTYYRGTHGNSHWYGQLVNMRVRLWNSMQKTDYDPCPQGWRVASNNAFSGIVAGQSSDNGRVWNELYFPCQGNYSWDITTGLGGGTVVQFWYSTSTNPLVVVISTNPIQTSSRFSYASPLRCMKE